MNFIPKAILALICGVALSFAQAPYDIWVLIFPCFGVFYYLYASLNSKRTIFTLSFLFSLGYFIASLNWIGNALLVEGNEFKWVWPLAVIALPCLLGLFTALYLTINHILFRNTALPKFFGFCVFLAFSEWVRGYAFTGFPWNLYGYASAANLNIAQSLSLIGPYGLTLLTIFWGASAGLLLNKTKHSYSYSVIVIALVTLATAYTYGAVRLSLNPTQYNEAYRFHLIQPNIAQAEKWEDKYLIRNFESHVVLSNQERDERLKHIYIWSETAVPPILLNSRDTNNRIQAVLKDNAILLAGTLTAEATEDKFKPAYYNALSLWDKNNNGTRKYAKTHLVPFGEYIPFQNLIPLKTVTQFNGFARGNGPETHKIERYPSFTSAICYEIIFPHKQVNASQPRPDYILTITNDGWYGDSAGPRQHFRQARFRAIEQGIPVVRAANTGISGVIDPVGRIIAKSNLLKIQTIEAKLPKHLSSNLPIYARLGDILFLILCMTTLVTSATITRRSGL